MIDKKMYKDFIKRSYKERLSLNVRKNKYSSKSYKFYSQ